MSFVAGFYIVHAFAFIAVFMVVIPVPIARWWSVKMRTVSPWRRVRRGMAAADAMTPGTVRYVGAAGMVLLMLGCVTTFLPNLAPAHPWIVLSGVSFVASAVVFAVAVRYALHASSGGRKTGLATLTCVATILLLMAIALSLLTA